MKKLIAYFSKDGENYFDGKVKPLKIGTTEIVANIIHELTDADMFKIEPAAPYSNDYYELTKEAKRENDNEGRPAIFNVVEDMDQYDTIYLGFPNWFGSFPRIISTFIESYDLKGKTIKPFCTSEGSGLGFAQKELEAMLKKSNVKEGISILSSDVLNCKEEIKNWILK